MTTILASVRHAPGEGDSWCDARIGQGRLDRFLSLEALSSGVVLATLSSSSSQARDSGRLLPSLIKVIPAGEGIVVDFSNTSTIHYGSEMIAALLTLRRSAGDAPFGVVLPDAHHLREKLSLCKFTTAGRGPIVLPVFSTLSEAFATLGQDGASQDLERSAVIREQVSQALEKLLLDSAIVCRPVHTNGTRYNGDIMQERHSDGLTLIRILAPKITANTPEYRELSKRLAELASRPEPPNIIIDLGAVGDKDGCFIDAMVFGLVLATSKTLQEKGAELSFRNVPDVVWDSMVIKGLHRLLKIE